MWRILVVSLALLPLMGCGPKRNQGGVVSGKITYKGTPVNGATLRLWPIPGPGEQITIPVSQEGTFHTANIPPGEYKIVVEPAPTGAMLSVPTKGIDPERAAKMKEKLQAVQGPNTPTIPYPDKYKDVVHTDLKCTIKEGDQPLTLELK